VASNKLLYAGVLPYHCGDNGRPAVPIVRIQGLPNPGCFFGTCVAERLISVQQDWNDLQNRETEYMHRCSIGQLTYEVGSIDEDETENEIGSPGLMIPREPGTAPPMYLQNPPLPAIFAEKESMLQQQFNVLSGVSDLTRSGQVPTGVQAARAMSLILEQDQTRLSITVSNITDAWIKSGQQLLRISHENAKMPRLLKQYGKQQILPITSWVGTDIQVDDVVCDMSSLSTESPTVRKQNIIEMMQTGLFNDPKTGKLSPEGRAKVFEMLEYGEDFCEFDDADQMHIDKADRENQKMLQGQPVRPDPWDANDFHIERHNRCRISVDYEDLVANNPVIAQIFDVHIQLHLMAAAQSAQMQMMQMQPPAAPGMMPQQGQAAPAEDMQAQALPANGQAPGQAQGPGQQPGQGPTPAQAQAQATAWSGHQP
jgi:hypothetical protein